MRNTEYSHAPQFNHERSFDEDRQNIETLRGVMLRDIGHAAVGVTVEIDTMTDVERSANYEGNWTQAQTERMASEDFRQRFEMFITNGAAGLKDVVEPFDKERVTRAEYISRIEQFPNLHENTTSKLGYVTAETINKPVAALGTAVYHSEHSEATVFSDAAHEGLALTDRQKDIIAAHEMYHGLINPRGGNVSEVRMGFELNVISEFNARNKEAGSERRAPSQYMSDPNELTARMAQLKNYFGMQGSEEFTSAHLEYARQHYIEDTGLDNNMTLFFEMADDENFIHAMNTLPV